MSRLALTFLTTMMLSTWTGRAADDPLAPLLDPGAGPPSRAPRGATTNRVGLPAGIPEGAIIRAPTTRRPTKPGKPRFELRAGDRVLWLGDPLLEREAELGYLETRMTVEYPDLEVLHRHLASSTNNPLAHPGPKATAAQTAEAWLEPLLAQVAAAKPTVVVLGFGTTAMVAGEQDLAEFKTNYVRLLDGLKPRETNQTLRLVLLSPIAQLAGPEASADATNRNPRLQACARDLQEIAAQRGAEFVDLHTWTLAEGAWAKKGAAQGATNPPPFLDDGPIPSRYGYLRLALALERGLRWPADQWRFGVLPDNKLRPGGFGVELVSHVRDQQRLHALTLEDRLPVPNVPGFADLQPESKPQCYIQLPGLQPGRYSLLMDRQLVLTGTDAEWGRYEIISWGPQWDQAEQLRQAIVQKNALVAQLWRQLGAPSTPGAAAVRAQGPDSILFTDPGVKELEAKIAKLRKPVQRTLEILPEAEAKKLAQPPGGGPPAASGPSQPNAKLADQTPPPAKP